MKDINFKLNADVIECLKKFCQVRAIKFTRDLLIKTDKDKNIVTVLKDLNPTHPDHATIRYPTHNNEYQKSNSHFMFYIHEAKIKMRELTYKYQITPIAIPPVADYDVRIFSATQTCDTRPSYFMEMTTSYDLSEPIRNNEDPRLIFVFPINKVTKDTVQY